MRALEDTDTSRKPKRGAAEPGYVKSRVSHCATYRVKGRIPPTVGAAWHARPVPDSLPTVPVRHGLRHSTAVLLTVLLAATACSPGQSLSPLDPDPRAASDRVATVPGLTPQEARTALDSLGRVARSPATAPYERDAFGSAWADVDGNGCNQRDDVLLRDAVPGTVTVAPQGACPHDVLAGTWVDPYTGAELVMDDLKDLAQAQAVQIDHVVPLAEAWRSGADAWTAQRRREFANDLRALLAVDGPTNMGKGDDDPAAWRPRASYQCAYATRWIDVKHRWGLGADDSERRALAEMLEECL